MNLPLRLCVFASFLLSVRPILGQAWTPQQGKSFTKVSYGAITAKDQYTFDGTQRLYADNVEENAFFDRSLYLYSELGVSDNVSLILTLPYKRTIIRDAAYRYRTFAIGNASLGTRVNLRKMVGWQNTNNALAANLTLNMPTGYTRNYAPSVGTGQADAQLTLNYGRSFYPKPAYFQAGAGYMYRSGFYGMSKAIPCQEGVNLNCIADRKPNFDNMIVFSAETGYTLAKRVLLQALVQGGASTKIPETGFSVTNPFPTRQQYLKVGSGISVYPLKRIGFSGQFFLTPFGKNTIKSSDIFLGIEVK